MSSPQSYQVKDSPLADAASDAAPATSPLELPEILSLIISYLDTPSLVSGCQVSRAFHHACIPHLWRDISLTRPGVDNFIWKSAKGFRMGFIRYGRFISSLALHEMPIQDGDLELIAENCTKLKSLDLTGTNVTVETLRVLIHGDPYEIGKRREEKGKRKRGRAPRRVEGADGSADSERSDSDQDTDVKDNQETQSEQDEPRRPHKYRGLNPLTETETEHDHDSQYESFGPGPSTATESEQEPLVTGPVFGSRRRVATSAPMTSAGGGSSQPNGSHAVAAVALEVPVHRRGGATRPAKFKGVRTPFPRFLETLILNRCNNLVGTSCLPVVALLGPQLRCLQLKHLSDTSDKDLIAVMQVCPNLKQLMLKGTDITDSFLIECATGTRKAAISEAGRATQEDQQNLQGHQHPSNNTGSDLGVLRYGVEKINVDMTNTTGAGLISLIQNGQWDLKSLSCQHHSDVTDEMIQAFFKRDVPVPSGLQPNTVLTEIDLSFCSGLRNTGIQDLFQYATALQRIVIEESEAIDDHALWILAKVQRQRMARLGLGVPEAWRDHVKAEQRRLRQKQDLKSSENVTEVLPGSVEDTQEALELRDEALLYDGSEKTIKGDFSVPGGLRTLVLQMCPHIHNRGMRAIVRSCVGLEQLSIRHCHGLSIQLFNGPWAVGTRLDHLDVSSTSLKIDSRSTSLRDQHEEGEELVRFPQISIPVEACKRTELASEANQESQDAEEAGHPNNIEDPQEPETDQAQDPQSPADLEMHESFADWESGSDFGSDMGSDLGSDSEDSDGSGDEQAPASRRHVCLFHNPENLAYLRSFYYRLGRLSGLRHLNMATLNFRIRLQDGLDLLVPGLQKNLEVWDVTMSRGLSFRDEELEFIGQHFGRGLEFPEGVVLDDMSSKNDQDAGDESKEDGRIDGVEGEKEEEEEEDGGHGDSMGTNDQSDVKNNLWLPRIAPLKVIRMSEESLYQAKSDVLYWFEEQGFDLDIQNDDPFFL
ncbi:hypothetical protein EMPS_03066 [Entomortierella parvispora]|uniref:F-box domain-containing protein n=1 Tax=Entomortierella parvispora TaxID=205924 RepID=A0A9P3H5V9_9FUNG|nr:hypothetical protein EMPS_03066 [Entomortierella parvispora]